MKWNKCVKLPLIFFVFVTMLISILSGIAQIIFFYKVGFKNGYLNIHLIFLINIFMLSTMIGTTLATILSNKLFKPLQDVVSGIKKVAKGDFSIRVHQKKSTDSDISQLIDSFNYMAEELSSIEMFRQDFINNFSHEFKTPISSIIGYAKELKRSDLSDQERENYLSIIISESERLSTLSSNILLLAKVENQKIIADKTEFSLDEQIRNCIVVLQKTWEDKNIEWDLQLDQTIYYGDEDLLSQVWLNLLSNAIKFSHTNGKITISCKKKNDDEIKIRICDEGIGMDDKTIEHAFDKFYQGDDSHATHGNGLGLSLVKEIMDLCHGKIYIRSRLDVGTTISILLPIKDA